MTSRNRYHIIRNLEVVDDLDNFQMEIDLLVVNSDVAVLAECKSNLSVDRIKKH